jgi:hypothetical protein
MRLSEAIALGRTMLIPGLNVFKNRTKGCALEMAMAAIGSSRSWNSAEKTWPWLNKERISPLPCACPERWYRVKQFKRCVIHIFNHVICGEITFDQLIDWVRSVEPAEDVPILTDALAESEAQAGVGEKRP